MILLGCTSSVLRGASICQYHQFHSPATLGVAVPSVLAEQQLKSPDDADAELMMVAKA